MKKLMNLTDLRQASLLSLFAFTLVFASCKKDSPDATDTSLSDAEVAEAVSESVAGTSGGVSTQTETTARLASTTTLSCGASSDTTISGQNIPGAIITYNYALNFHRSLVCAAGIPSEFNATFDGSSSYTAVRMSSADNSNASFSLTGLPASSLSYVINGSYTRNGTQQSTVRFQRSFSSTITITSSDVNVSKATQKIISGSASVHFSAQVSGGAAVTRGGTLTFLGNSQATLLLDNGSSFPIQW